MMKRALSIALALMIALLGVAQAEFVDDAGRAVAVEEGIEFVAPAGNIAQMAIFAVAPDALVGLANDWPESAAGIIGEEYYNLPYIGKIYQSADMNVETLALAAPQAVIDIGEAKDSIAEDMDTLQQSGIPALFLSATIEDTPEMYRKLGRLLGREAEGEELAQFCQRVYARTANILAQVGDDRARVLYVLGEEGLNVLAQGSYHAEMLDWLAENVAVVDNPVGRGTGNAVSMEQMMLWEPEVVLFAPRSVYADVAEDPVWREMDAIAQGRYVEIPDGPYCWMGSPPGVQRYLGMIWLTALLYPEYCDYDVEAEVREYYRLFYHCELTDEMYEVMTANAFIAE